MVVLSRLFAFVSLSFVAASAAAVSVADGRALYQANCASCHSVPPDYRALLAANNPDKLVFAINSVSGMGPLRERLSRTDIESIAAFIGDPVAAQTVLTVGLLGAGRGVVRSEPSTIFCGGICAAAYATDAVIRLVATPMFGSRVVGWSGECQVDQQRPNECVVRMSGARTVFARFERNGHESDHTDLWWVGTAENGWGMSIVHRAGSGQQFNVFYVYDDTGRPTWYVMPGGRWNDTFTTFSGALYQPRGARLDRFDPRQVVVGDTVGDATLRFSSGQVVELDYTISGRTGAKRLTRQAFATGNGNSVPMVGDMWWGGASQSGWGLALLQQQAMLFGIWYTYDLAGKPTWYVMPGGVWSGARFTGTLFETRGSPWVGRPYDQNALVVMERGAMTVDFEAQPGLTATFTAGEFAGFTLRQVIERQPF